MNDETRSSDGRGDITGRTIAGWMGAVVAGAVVLSGLVLQVDTAGAAGSGRVEKPRASECVGWVALTFDDGPVVGEGGTLGVIEVLEELKVPGTFFMLGREMKRHPEEVRAVLDARGAAGRSVIGNGTWSHPDLRGLTERQVNRQLMKTSRVYRRISGGELSFWRPPYGAGPGSGAGVSGEAVARLGGDRLGMTETLWTVDPQNWRGRMSVGEVVRGASGAVDGGIITLQEGARTTVAALPRIVEGYWARGLCFGVLEESAVAQTPVESPALEFWVRAVRPPSR